MKFLLILCLLGVSAVFLPKTYSFGQHSFSKRFYFFKFKNSELKTRVSVIEKQEGKSQKQNIFAFPRTNTSCKLLIFKLMKNLYKTLRKRFSSFRPLGAPASGKKVPSGQSCMYGLKRGRGEDSDTRHEKKILLREGPAQILTGTPNWFVSLTLRSCLCTNCSMRTVLSSFCVKANINISEKNATTCNSAFL